MDGSQFLGQPHKAGHDVEPGAAVDLLGEVGLAGEKGAELRALGHELPHEQVEQDGGDAAAAVVRVAADAGKPAPAAFLQIHRAGVGHDVPAGALSIERAKQTEIQGWSEKKLEKYIAKKQKLEAEKKNK